MNYVLFAEMDQVFSLKKNYKNTGKVGEFCQPRKVGTMFSQKAKIESRK